MKYEIIKAIIGLLTIIDKYNDDLSLKMKKKVQLIIEKIKFKIKT